MTPFLCSSKLSKMLQICSNSTWWIHFVSWFHTTNMRKIGACLTMSKILHFVSKMTWGTWTQLGHPGRNQLSHCVILMKLGLWHWVDHRLMHMLWICSYLASKITSQKTSSYWIWAKLEQFWQFGPQPVQIFGHCQKCSEFVQIGCDNFFCELISHTK